MREDKNKIWKYFFTLFLFVLLMCVTDVQPAQAAVKMSASSMNLCVGERTKLTLTGTSKKAKWKSDKPSVIKVSSTGSVLAKGTGTATVTATVSKKNYKCKFYVNNSFKVDKTSISIKQDAHLTAFLSVNGSVNASVADKKICSVSFGKWDGDNMPLVIVPKKVGSTTIKFTNSANQESCTLKVKVTALPSTATFQTASVNTGSDTFIVGENIMCFAFRLNRAAKKVVFKIYDSDNEVARTFDIGALAAKKTVSIQWDGLDEDGRPMDGSYKYAVVADGIKTSGGRGTVLSVSPFGTGDGTQDNPFRVSNVAELRLIKNYNGAFFAQDEEIDFDYESIDPLFSDEAPFTGTYDGKYASVGYRMINLLGGNSVFGTVGAKGVIRNVNMSNCVLNTTGGLLADTNNGTIETCTINGNILCNSGSQAAMVVLNNNGRIRDCRVSGKLRVVADHIMTPMVLMAGSISVKNTGTIIQCTSSVEISQQLTTETYVPAGAYEIYTGGIVAENASNAFVIQCTFTGSIEARVVLPDAGGVGRPEGGKIYSGFVTGMNNGYAGSCVNASADAGMSAQGTGNGTVQ